MSVVAPKKRGPYAPSLRRKAEIAEAVLEIVDELGPDAVTVALVAERVRSNDATVLYHFPTKDHLLVAALERSDDKAASDAHVDEPAPAVNLEDWAPLQGVTGARQRLLAVLSGQASIPGHPAREYLQRRNERAIDIYTRLIERRQTDGLAHPGINARDAACQILALLAGLDSLELLGVSFDKRATVDAFRRLTGADWMETRARLLDEDLGL